MMAPRTRDLAMLGVAVVAISTAAPLIRAAAAPALAVAFWRTALALPVTSGLVVAGRRSRRPAARREERPGGGPVTAAAGRSGSAGRSRRDRWLSVLAGVLLAGHFATWVPSLSFTSVASSVALVCTQPVWAAAVARMRGEHVPARVWRAIAVALAGVVLLTGVDLAVSARALLGDLLALAGGVLAALYVTVGSEVRKQVPTAVYTTICYVVAAAVLLIVCLVAGQPLAGYPAATWLALLGLAAGPQLLGHTVVNLVLRTLTSTVVSVAILFEIVGAAMLAWVLFGEAPSPSALPAAVLICTGIVGTVRAMARGS